jgi:hypothetical protein
MKSYKEIINESTNPIEKMRDLLATEQDKNKKQKAISSFYDKNGMKGIVALEDSIRRFGKRPRMKAKAKSMQNNVDTFMATGAE